MRSAAWPSHMSGIRLGVGLPFKTKQIASRIRPEAVPARLLVPTVHMPGRSGFSRLVMHGTQSTVVSSWIPPLSG
jgi:hypothetical protein